MDKNIKFLTKIIKQSANFIENEHLVVKAKDNLGDVVTNFDTQIEKFLIEQIKKKYPSFDIVSEEFNTFNTPTPNCFIIDPIDGTSNFASGLPLWGIQIAMIKESKVCGAVIYLPKLKELFWANKTGAYCGNKKISVKHFSPKQVMYAVEGKNRMPATVRMKNFYPHSRCIGCSAVIHSWIAKGIFGAFAFLSDGCWDYVPGQYLVQQAGGVILNGPHLHIASCDKHLAYTLKKQCGFYDDDKVFTNHDDLVIKGIL